MGPIDGFRMAGSNPWLCEAFFSKSLMNKANGAPMERELTPVEARSGVVSGRVLTVLALSSVGAVVALALAWLFLFPR